MQASTSLPSVSIPSLPQDVPLPGNPSSNLSLDEDPSADDSSSESSDNGSEFFHAVLENEHIGEELASVVSSAQRVDAPGPGTEVPSDDVYAKSVANESDSVIPMTVSSAGEDHCSAAFIDDYVRAAGAPRKRMHCSGSGNDDNQVPPKVADRSSCEPILDSEGGPSTLLGEQFSEPSAVYSPLSIPNSAVDRRANLLGPPPREPALLEDGLLGTPLQFILTTKL